MKMTLSEFIDHLSTVENVGTTCGFDMEMPARGRNFTRNHPCGSACCIGGHAGLLLGDEWNSPQRSLQALTGIPWEDAYAICFPKPHRAYKATLQQAVLMLEHYAATGEVRWEDFV